MKKKIALSGSFIAAVLIIAIVVTVHLQYKAECVHAEFDFSLENPAIVHTVLEHIGASVKNSPSKLADTDFSSVVISGPALIYELDNGGKTLSNTLARYYFRFATGDVGRVDIRARGGMIVSSGSGLHARYIDASERAHVLIINDFYGEYLADLSGTHLHKAADAQKTDYPEETFISNFAAGILARRYGRTLANHAASSVPWETLTYVQLETRAE